MDKLNTVECEAIKEQDNTSVSDSSQNISNCNDQALSVENNVDTNASKVEEENIETHLQSQSVSFILQWEEEAKLRAVKQIAGMLRRPEQLEKVGLQLVAQNCQ